MAEMTHTSEYHRDAMLICRSNGFIITHRPTWLDNSKHTDLGSVIDAITEKGRRHLMP